MNLWIPMWLLWIIGGTLCLIVAGIIYKRGQEQSFYLGPMLDPFAMLWVGVLGAAGLFGLGKGLVTLLH